MSPTPAADASLEQAGELKIGQVGIAMPHAQRLLAGDRAALARAITLAESKRPDHRAAARGLIDAVLPQTGTAIRVGITGVPGVGKSTTIDALGANLTAAGHRVAVLAVDPSSPFSGGALLGDRVPMESGQVAIGRFLVAVILGQLSGSTFAGLLEAEIGWRGVLAPTLRARFGEPAAGSSRRRLGPGASVPPTR